jgi:hypothetical protein
MTFFKLIFKSNNAVVTWPSTSARKNGEATKLSILLMIIKQILLVERESAPACHIRKGYSVI